MGELTQNNAAGLTRPKRVLVVSATVGSGHNTAAKAIIASLESSAPAGGLDIQFVDILQYMPRWFRVYYASGFALSMTRLSKLYGLGFKLADHPQKPARGLLERCRLWAENRAAGRFRQLVIDQRPDLIITTHFLPAPIIAGLRQQGAVDAPLFMVVTDIQVHRWWYCPQVDHWFVPQPPSAGPLLRWGIDERKITVSGIPIRPAWERDVDADEARAIWRIPEGSRLVLLSGGTEFTVGPVRKIARNIARRCENTVVAVLAGRNKKLLGQHAAMKEAPQKIIPVGFTDRVHELVQLADVMVTKPGGITTAECLRKGTPMVLMNPVPGQEGGNAEFLADQGAAVIAHGTAQIVNSVCRLLADRTMLRQFAANALRLSRPGTATITKAVLDALSQDT